MPDYPATLDPETVVPRTKSIYPSPYAEALDGREKRTLGDAFGLTQFGVNHTVLAPGTWSSQRHWHEKEDEFIYVLSGEVTLIDDAGEHLLAAGMCAGFKSGVPNGHHLVNRSTSPAIVLEVGSRAPDEVAHYSEADMLARKTADGFIISRKDGTPY